MPNDLILQRLNLDSSWYLNWQGTGVVIDPWLVGSEVDIARWFNEQWHSRQPVAPSEIPDYHFTLVTQSYSDHCHEATLREMNADRPVLAVPKANKRLKKTGLRQELLEIPDWTQGPLVLDGLEIGFLDPGRLIDPIYYGVVLAKSVGDQKKSDRVCSPWIFRPILDNWNLFLIIRWQFC